MTEITDHLADTRARVAKALARAGRSGEDVLLLAVSKHQPAAAIREAFAAGQRHFAENYVAEALEKMALLEDLPIEWHFIGALQSNKTRPVAERFAWVHTVDREKLVRRLSAQRPRFAPPLNVLIQVNQAGEPQKAGVAEERVGALAELIEAEPRLRFKGLMSIPPAQPAASGVYFSRLRDLKNRLQERGIEVPMLSMGMTADFEIAIENGSNCVRIGTGIFGPRPA